MQPIAQTEACIDVLPSLVPGEDVARVPIDEQAAQDLARIFQALSDPTRVRIIALLIDHEPCVHTITAALGMTQSAISHQLRTLRDMRLVRARKDGRHVYYTLDDRHIADLFAQGLAHIQHS